MNVCKLPDTVKMRCNITDPCLRRIHPAQRQFLDAVEQALGIQVNADDAETTLARMIAPHYARAEHEARALLREAFTLPGDIYITDGQLHVNLDPATAPRRNRALNALCKELTATETTYPGTDLTITYTVKDQPDPS